MLKKIICTLLAISLLFALTPSIFAANSGLSMEDALDVEFGTSYDIAWNKDTIENNCYHKLIVTEQGYVTFHMTKPINGVDNYVAMDLAFTDIEGNAIWHDETYHADDTLDYYEYSIGLKPGEYYFNMIPKTTYFGDIEITSTYSFTFTATNYCEIEPNANAANATKIELGQVYTGFWGDTDGEEDWFTFDLEEGKTTRVYIGNFEHISANTYTLLDMMTADEEDFGYMTHNMEYIEAEDAYGFTFVPHYTGKYYLRWWNNHFSQFPYTIKVTQIACQHSFNEGKCTICGEADPNYTLPETPNSNPFKDVHLTDYFYDPVLWAVDKGVTTGMSATSFGPNANCTRGQIVTFLYRASGSPEPTKTDNPFKDVKSGDYYYKAVLWAVENGITTGLSATSFGPNATCTRGQVATFLWRSQGEPAPTSTNNPFSDVKTSDYYFNAVLWAVENNVTQGMGAGKFAPNASCTRGQIVTFLYRALA